MFPAMGFAASSPAVAHGGGESARRAGGREGQPGVDTVRLTRFDLRYVLAGRWLRIAGEDLDYDTAHGVDPVVAWKRFAASCESAAAALRVTA